MANFLSDQLTNAAAKPPVMNLSTEGDSYRKWFSWTGDAAQNDTVQLALLPKGARIINGSITTSALGASVTGSIGDGTTAAKYLSAGDFSAVATLAFAHTVALSGVGSGGQLASNITLTLTLAGANPAAGTIYGYVDFLLV